LKIVADENIPLVEELFASFGEVVLLPGRQIHAEEVKDADILLVRSVTNVEKNLLTNSKVKFVGTATTGTDHVDIDWLNEAGIAFASAKGCNAEAVAEYVIGSVASLRHQDLLPQKNLRAGVIGVGNVGSKVSAKLKILGFDVLQNDPPRAKQEKNFPSIPLSDFVDLDLICIHTPLIKNGSFPTFHLINHSFLKNLKPNLVLLNAGRGAVIDFSDLEHSGQQLLWCFDVWEHEPQIDLSILKKATLATPHIAGYTFEAKLRGTLMLYQAAQKLFNFSLSMKAASLFPKIEIKLERSADSWEKVLLQIYNPIDDTERMRDILLSAPKEIAAHFDQLRKHYPKRHEFSSIVLKNTEHLTDSDKSLLGQLGLRIAD
jgi:erythronate-4-phosphate dehydrogenase